MARNSLGWRSSGISPTSSRKQRATAVMCEPNLGKCFGTWHSRIWPGAGNLEQIERY
jgi:hypothetical protein